MRTIEEIKQRKEEFQSEKFFKEILMRRKCLYPEKTEFMLKLDLNAEIKGCVSTLDWILNES